MKNSKDVLGSVLKTTQMGQVGIRAVLPYVTKTELKSALRDQLNEYNCIEAQAQRIATNYGWQLKNLNPMAKVMSRMYTQTNLSFGNIDSKIAAMMVQGNTRGIIKGLKNKHHSPSTESQILAVAQKLIECEDANIKQMQGFI